MRFDYAERRARLAEAMERERVDLLFVPRGTDLEYLAGLERDAPTYGAHGYTHDWVAGAFFRPGHDPVFCLPRLVSLVHVKSELPGEIVVFDEPADGWALFEQVAARLGPAATVGVSSRAGPSRCCGCRRRSPARASSTAASSSAGSACSSRRTSWPR